TAPPRRIRTTAANESVVRTRRSVTARARAVEGAWFGIPYKNPYSASSHTRFAPLVPCQTGLSPPDRAEGGRDDRRGARRDDRGRPRARARRGRARPRRDDGDARRRPGLRAAT